MVGGGQVTGSNVVDGGQVSGAGVVGHSTGSVVGQLGQFADVGHAGHWVDSFVVGPATWVVWESATWVV